MNSKVFRQCARVGKSFFAHPTSGKKNIEIKFKYLKFYSHLVFRQCARIRALAFLHTHHLEQILKLFYIISNMLIFAYIWRKRAQMGKKNFFKAWIRKLFNFKQTLKKYSIVCKQ